MWGHMFSFLLSVPKRIADHGLTLCLIFWGTANCSKVVASCRILTSIVYRFQFLHILANTFYCPFSMIAIPIYVKWWWMCIVATTLNRVLLNSQGLKWIQSEIINFTLIFSLKSTFTEPLLSGSYYAKHCLRLSHLILIIPPAV